MEKVEGTWEKDVRVSSHFVMGLARTHPRGDPLNLSIENNHLKNIKGSILEFDCKEIIEKFFKSKRKNNKKS